MLNSCSAISFTRMDLLKGKQFISCSDQVNIRRKFRVVFEEGTLGLQGCLGFV